MKQSIRDKLENLVGRLDELERILSDAEATRDMEQYRKLTREHAELVPVIALYKAWQQSEADLRSAQGMLADPEMKDLAEEEIDAARARLPEIEDELQKLLLPKDANDERNIFSKSAPERAATNRRCSPAACSACMCVTPNGSAGRSKSSRRMKPNSVVTKR